MAVCRKVGGTRTVVTATDDFEPGYTMTCRIERVLTPDGFVVLRMSGRIDCTYVATLRESMEREKTNKGGLAIDLTEVTLVSREAVDALAVAEANGIELRDCPAYVREWVSRAKESHD